MKLFMKGKALAYFISAIIIFITTAAFVIKVTSNLIKDNIEISEITRLYETVEEIRLKLRSANLAQRDFINTGDSMHYNLYNNYKNSLFKNIEAIYRLDYENYIMKKNIDTLNQLIRKDISLLDITIITSSYKVPQQKRKRIYAQATVTYFKIRDVASDMETLLENRLGDFRKRTEIRAKEIVVALISGYSVAILLLISTLYSLIIHIRKREKAEIEVKKQASELSQLNATKDKFFSLIAHDLRNPFHNIQGLSELILSELQNKDYENIAEYTDYIRQSSIKTFELLENLLEWSKIQTGRLEAKPEKFHILDIIRENTLLLNEMAIKKDIRISINEKIDYYVYADKNMIKTIIRNLITNAIKFTSVKGEIIINANREDEFIKVSVSDTGMGINREDMQKLFQIDNTIPAKDSDAKGSGLGLILCKELIEINGGKIFAESEAGQGSTFYFTVPS
jgi:signal transduction histidine kinase